MAYSLVEAVSGGYAAGQKMGDDYVASRDLKQAQQDEQTAGQDPADMFKTYSNAGKLALQSGNARVADKFFKEANDYKGTALSNKIKEMEVHHEEVSDFERTIRANNNPDSLKAAVAEAAKSGKLNPQEQLSITGAIDQAQKNGKWDEFHKQIGSMTESYKEQSASQIALLKQQNAELKTEFDMDYKMAKLRNEANRSAGNPKKQTPEEKDAALEKKRSEHKEDQIEEDLEKEIAGIEGKDPKHYSPEEKKRQITEARNRAQIRKQQLQQRSTTKKSDTTKTKAPAYNDWLKAAKEKNPTASESDLKAFYEKKYKE